MPIKTKRSALKDTSFMALAFIEAKKVKGRTLPNPPVGAVLVKAGKVVGKGGTRPAGQSHAEIVALKKAGRHAKGGTLYVTLEPCSHHGRTPPCVLAIIAAGVKRVVIALQDVNPLVSGKGIQALRRAGLEVEMGPLAAEAAAFYDGFSFFILHGRPKIVLKIAQSLDGRINSRPGKETKITGEASRLHVHALRSRADAILIGGRTLRIDNPDLTPRLVSGPGPVPFPETIVLSRHGRLPLTSKLFAKNRQTKTVVLSHSGKGLPKWVEWSELPIPTKSMAGKPVNQQFSTLSALFNLFGRKGYHSILVEGGQEIWALFLNAGLWDTLYIATAPKLLPEGQRWDSELPQHWGKSLKFRNFACFENDYWAEFGNAISPGKFILGV